MRGGCTQLQHSNQQRVTAAAAVYGGRQPSPSAPLPVPPAASPPQLACFSGASPPRTDWHSHTPFLTMFFFFFYVLQNQAKTVRQWVCVRLDHRLYFDFVTGGKLTLAPFLLHRGAERRKEKRGNSPFRRRGQSRYVTPEIPQILQVALLSNPSLYLCCGSRSFSGFTDSPPSSSSPAAADCERQVPPSPSGSRF